MIFLYDLQQASSESESGVFSMSSSFSDDEDMAWSHSWPSTAWHCFLKGACTLIYTYLNLSLLTHAEELKELLEKSLLRNASQLKGIWSSMNMHGQQSFVNALSTTLTFTSVMFTHLHIKVYFLIWSTEKFVPLGPVCLKK